MAKLFDPATGLPAVIPLGTDPKYVSTDQVSGQDTYQIATSYTADQVRSLLSDLSSDGPVAAHVWIGTSDHLIRKATLDGAFGDGGREAAAHDPSSHLHRTASVSIPAP